MFVPNTSAPKIHCEPTGERGPGRCCTHTCSSDAVMALRLTGLAFFPAAFFFANIASMVGERALLLEHEQQRLGNLPGGASVPVQMCHTSNWRGFQNRRHGSRRRPHGGRLRRRGLLHLRWRLAGGGVGVAGDPMRLFGGWTRLERGTVALVGVAAMTNRRRAWSLTHKGLR